MDKKKFLDWALNFIHAHGIEEFQRLLANKIGIHLEVPMTCLWRAWAIDPAIKAADAIAAFKAGRIEKQLVYEKYNKIMDAYKAAIIANNIGTPTLDQDLEVSYIGLGYSDTRTGTGVPPTAADTQLTREAYRQTPNERYNANNQTLVVIAYLDASTANPTNTTVASGASTTQFTVQAGQGANYAQHDLIRVRISGVWYTVTVDGVVSDTITLKTSTPLPSTPTAGNEVQRGYGETMLFCGQATGTANTGTPVNHAELIFFKNSITSILVEANLQYVSA